MYVIYTPSSLKYLVYGSNIRIILDTMNNIEDARITLSPVVIRKFAFLLNKNRSIFFNKCNI